MTMTDTNERLQPHPLDHPASRATYVTAEVVTATGLATSLVLAIVAGVTGSLALAVATFVIGGGTFPAGRAIRTRAWASTPGAHGTRQWNAPRTRSRLIHDVVMTVVLGIAGIVPVLMDPSPITTAIVSGLDAYLVIALLVATRGDLPRAAVRICGPLLAGTIAVAAAALNDGMYTALSALILGALFGTLAGLGSSGADR